MPPPLVIAGGIYFALHCLAMDMGHEAGLQNSIYRGFVGERIFHHYFWDKTINSIYTATMLQSHIVYIEAL